MRMIHLCCAIIFFLVTSQRAPMTLSLSHLWRTFRVAHRDNGYQWDDAKLTSQVTAPTPSSTSADPVVIPLYAITGSSCGAGICILIVPKIREISMTRYLDSMITTTFGCGSVPMSQMLLSERNQCVMSKKKRVLVLCLGTICRYPIGEAVFNDYINKNGLQGKWEVESAVLIGYDPGRRPDREAMKTLQDMGLTNYTRRVRPITIEDFHTFDWILAMDNEHKAQLKLTRPSASKAKIELLGQYHPGGKTIIRDPYYDFSTEGFVRAYQQCVSSVAAFMETHANDV